MQVNVLSGDPGAVLIGSPANENSKINNSNGVNFPSYLKPLSRDCTQRPPIPEESRPLHKFSMNIPTRELLGALKVTTTR